MSVQFGRWNFEGARPRNEYIHKVNAILARYGPDSDDLYSKEGITILYRAFRTTKESRREKQPHISNSGAVISWDGRLDNRAEIMDELPSPLAITCTDIQIVSAAYEKWGAYCFGKLVGDWALSIYDPTDRLLILAKDPIGPRPLYYAFDEDQVTWCTILDPLVLLAHKPFALCEEYIAGWFSISFPAAHLTPYVGIHAVPPSSSVILRPGNHAVRKHWDFDPDKRIRYRTDAEYEEHFRSVFAKAIQRRLRSDIPVLAELSGGRDSSSIVCMADTIIARGEAETPRLDTISWYDDSEPNWNDRPYFTKVEEKRGRTGWHIDMSLQDPGRERPECPPNYCLVPTPGYDGRRSQQIGACLTSQGNRVVISGTGGDEVMGGVPVPTPELQDLLARARFGAFARQLKTWALQKRKPWFHLILEVARGFFPPRFVGVPTYVRPAPWLRSNFVRRHWMALTGYPSRVRLFGPLSSFQDNVSTIDLLRRQLACKVLQSETNFDKCYPYLDIGLLEFMFAIPRNQSVRPSQRRSLMRRALADILPDEILNRKTKAFVARAPMITISRHWASLIDTTHEMIISSVGIVEPERLFAALQTIRRGEQVFSRSIIRTLYIEGWVRYLLSAGIVSLDRRVGVGGDNAKMAKIGASFRIAIERKRAN